MFFISSNTDVNECASEKTCKPNEACVNTEGSFMCIVARCQTGYTGAKNNTCIGKTSFWLFCFDSCTFQDETVLCKLPYLNTLCKAILHSENSDDTIAGENVMSRVTTVPLLLQKLATDFMSFLTSKFLQIKTISMHLSDLEA